MTPKIAIITGISGQDGSYLAKLLINKGYQVHGFGRDLDTATPWRHSYLQIDTLYDSHTTDLLDYSHLIHLLKEIKPDEVYHLAAQSSVSASVNEPQQTLQFNVTSTINLLDAIKNTDPTIKIFNASSSEMYGSHSNVPVTIEHRVQPNNPYAISKAATHALTQMYRQMHGIHAVNGILFPHESPLRQPLAFSKSIVRQLLALKNKQTDTITLNNIDNVRDFGDAELFVEAMWQSLQAEKANDYIIATGKPTSIREIVYHVADRVGIEINDKTFSLPTPPNAPTVIYGDPSNTVKDLGWTHSKSIFETFDDIIEFESRANENRYES